MVESDERAIEVGSAAASYEFARGLTRALAGHSSNFMDAVATEQPTPIRVLLVHGTWPYGRWPASVRAAWHRVIGTRPAVRWFEERSTFREALLSRIPGSVSMDVFSWTGGNSAGARNRAVSDLEMTVRQSATQHPDAIRVVIAHSHGGNIVLRALEQLSASERPHGVVTIATPFIVARPRALLEWERHATLALRIMVLALPAAAILATVSRSALTPYHYIRAACALLISGAVLWIGTRIWQCSQRAVFSRPPAEQVDTARMLVIRAPGDEASLALGFGQVVGSLGYGIWRLLALPARLSSAVAARLPKRLASWLLAPVLLMLALRLVQLLTSWWDPQTCLWWRIAAYAVLITYFFIPIAIAMLALPVAAATLIGVLFALLGRVGFGVEYGLSNLSVEVAAEAVPPGEYKGQLYLVSPNDIPAELNGMRHSAHELDCVRSRVATWMCELRHVLVARSQPMR